MSVGKNKLLAAFLEKDNLKLLVYDVFGSKSVRSFAGQITFSAEVLKDAYIADPAKFSGQVKMAIIAKPALAEATELVLFMPTDKTFSKSLPLSDNVDSFIQSLPYFAEELIINNQEPRNKKQNSLVTHVAFEKKLVEDFQRPFMESGKKVAAVKSGVNVLITSFRQPGRYFLLVPLEKEIAMAVVTDGAVSEMTVFGRDVFVARFFEYIANHNLDEVRNVYSLGVFEAGVVDKIKSEKGMEVVSIGATDVYDLIVETYLKSRNGNKLTDLLSKLPPLPPRKSLLLVGVGLVGLLLVVFLVKGLREAGLSKTKKTAATPTVMVPAVVPEPEAKATDYKVRVLNGTLVEGEAGRLADKIKELGFEIKETKNATTAGFVTSRLRATVDVPTKITEKIRLLLVETYDSVSKEVLASDSAGVKIEIIIGKKK